MRTSTTASPRRGELWLVRFPFTDLTSTKLRPCLVWATHGQDVVVLGLFSRVPAGAPRRTWVLVERGHPQFRVSGLKQTSLLRAEKIAVVHESVFQSRLGRLPQDLMPRAERALKDALHIV